MGLFDSVMGAASQAAGGALGEMLGQAGGSSGNLMDGLSGLIGSGGGEGGAAGLAGLVQKFQESGLSEVVASWVSTGPNLPVTAEQISQVFDNETVGRFAQSVGVDPQQAAGQIASLLPKVVDALTPDGQLPSGEGTDLSGLLQKGLGGLLGR
jgi:uncharacterized protein YidB (DUF937 family)